MSSLIVHDEPVLIWTGKVMLDGRLTVPPSAPAVVVIASLGGTFHHAGYRALAERLNQNEFATIVADLLTPDEQQFDARTGHFRVDLPFLAGRAADIVQWVERHASTRDLPVGYFGAGIAGSAGLLAAAKGLDLFGIVLNASRVDVVGDAAARLTTPALMVTEKEGPGAALAPEQTQQVVIDGAAALLEDEAALEAVARHSVEWLHRHLPVTV